MNGKKLWVEDFDHGRASPEDFDFPRENTDICTTLSEALCYIHSQYGLFDTVILDINLDLGDLSQAIPHLRQVLHPHHALTIRLYRLTDIEKAQLGKNAGFYVYLYLLHLGFPRDRICFLTANKGSDPGIAALNELEAFFVHHDLANAAVLPEAAKATLTQLIKQATALGDQSIELRNLLTASDMTGALELIRGVQEACAAQYELLSINDTYYDWDHRFYELGLQIPEAFHKKLEMSAFRAWLGLRDDSPYFRLRYAIRAASLELKERMRSTPGFWRFTSDFYLPKEQNAQKDPDHYPSYFSERYFEELLDAMADLLPMTEPAEDVKQSLYRQLIRMISHDWEGVSGINHRAARSGSTQELKDDTYYDIMHNLRNWSAHNKILIRNEAEVAFFILIAFRAWFALDALGELSEYEKRLLDLLKLPGDDYPTIRGELLSKLNQQELLINQVYQKLRSDLHSGDRRRRSTHTVRMQEILINLGRELPQCPPAYLVLLIWIGMCELRIDNFGGNVLNVKYQTNRVRTLLQNDRELFSHLYCYTLNQVQGYLM